MSSKGDEAAYLLACIYIDSGRLQKAFRLLTDLISRYPDLSVPRKEILLRQAYTCARLGDPASARRSLKQITETTTGYLRNSSLEAVEQAVNDVEDAEKRSDSLVKTTDTDPALLASSGLGTVWSLTLPVTVQQSGQIRQVSFPQPRKKPAVVAKSELERLVERWKNGSWFPADQIVIHNNLLYISCLPDLLCVDLTNGRTVWKSRLPEKGTKTNTVRVNYYYGRQQMTQLENFAFGNRVARALSMYNGLIFRIERHLSATLTTNVFGRQPAGAVGNRLVAYDSASGSPLWDLGLNPDGESEFHAVRFLSAPVVCSNNILVPVERKDGLTLYALDPRTGKVRWRRFVCAYLAGQSPAADKAGITVDGSSIFLATGQGVVMALDGIDGTIYWASQYERQPPPSNAYWHRQQNNDKTIGGWDDNTLICSGSTLALLPSDSDVIIGFERDTGKRTYRIKQEDCKYSLGMLGDRFLVAGRTEIRCHKVSSGEVLWSRAVSSSFGRGTLVGSTIALPTEKGLLVLDPLSGKDIRTISAGIDAEIPLGNVFFAKKQLFFIGANRLFALRDRETHLADLNAAVKADGSCRAYTDRGRFFLLLGEVKLAVEDLRKAISLTENSEFTLLFRNASAEIETISNEISDNTDILKVSGTSIFTDDFNREELGNDWTSDKVAVKIDNGAVVLNVKENNKGKIIRYVKELTGDFRAEYDGWQNTGALCDLSLMMYVKKPDNTETSIDIAFGANLNVRNMIVVERRRVTETTNYLMKRGKKHHLVVMRIGNRIVMTADGIVVHDYENADLKLGKDTRYQLGLYGWDSEHFFDNFKVALISPEEISLITANRQKKLQQIDALRAQLVDLRANGYVKPGPIKTSLFKALMLLAAADATQALALIEEARGIAATEEERLSVAFAEAEAREKNNDPLGAAQSYFSLLDNAGATLFPFKDGEKEHLVTVREVMVRNLARLNRGHGKEVGEFISGVIDKKLAALKTKGDANGLWNLYCALPAHERAAEIGLLAAEMAKCSDGSPSMALREAALMAVSVNHNPEIAAGALTLLGAFYDQQEWSALAVKTWRKLKDEYGEIKVRTATGITAGSILADAALAAKRPAAEPSQMPSPPFKLLWKSDHQFQALQNVMYGKASDFEKTHIVDYDYRGRRFVSRLLKTGKEVWATTASSGSINPIMVRNYNHPGSRSHILYAHSRNQNQLQAYDKLNGKTLWSIGGIANQVFEGDGLIVSLTNANGEISLRVLDAVTGGVLWQRGVHGYYQCFIVDGKVVAYGQVHTAAGGAEATCMTLDGRTGEILNSMKLSQGVRLFNDRGVICQAGNTVSCLSFLDGKELWSTELNAGARVQSLNSDKVFALVTPEELSLYNLDSGKRIWTAKLGEIGAGGNYRPALSRGSNEVLVYTYSNKSQNLIILDRETGEIKDTVKATWSNQQGQWVQHIGAGKRFVPVMITKQEMQGNRVVSYNRDIRFVDRKSGKFAANVVLPRKEDVGAAPKHSYYQLAVISDIIILSGSGKTFAYVHDDAGAEIELEEVKFPETTKVPSPQPLLNMKINTTDDAKPASKKDAANGGSTKVIPVIKKAESATRKAGN